ncbi:MAG: hypothetical protein ACYDHH_11580 [Solirubrobacteraceae bacterium]
MTGVDQLLLWMVGIHVLGLVAIGVLLFPALRDENPGPPQGGDSGSDDGWGNNPRRPEPPRNVPGGGLPLPDALPARVRLRDARRLHERLPRRERRPAREPARTPVRTPARHR